MPSCSTLPLQNTTASFDTVFRVFQHVIHGIVAVIIFARFDFDGYDFSFLLYEEIQFTELFAVVVIEGVAVCGQFLGCDIFVDRAEIDRCLVLQDPELDFPAVL